MATDSESRALSRAIVAHRAAFGLFPSRQAIAPGRVNLVGEHTDYNGGLVLPMAIQLCCAAAISPRPDSRIRIVAADLAPPGSTFESDLRSLRPADFVEARTHWAAYVAGPAAILFERAGRAHGVDVTIASDVPLGAGLSSSAAAEVCVTLALAAEWQVQIGPLDLAMLCQRAEHEYAGVPCGLMDQLASVFGEAGNALLIDCRENSIEPVPLPAPQQAALIVANSGVRHSLAAGEYARRRASCEAAASAMGLGSLRDVVLAEITAADLTADQSSCAMHVVSENERVRRFVDSIKSDDLAEAGSHMNASHASLRDRYRVSCPELDTLVEIAQSVPGVFGSRMTGGGFGGCTITLCDPAAVEPLTHELRIRYRTAHGRDCEHVQVVPSAGARLVDLSTG